MRRTSSYIYEQPDWPDFRWDSDALAELLAAVRHKQGRFLGRMEAIGFELRTEASLTTLTADVVKSSAIEGETLNTAEVRSSIARRLGLDAGGLHVASRNVDGVVEMTLDATQRFEEDLTDERLFGWHSALFPTGHSGMNRIAVGQWRPVEAGEMQVISGPMGKERIHFEAPKADRLNGEMEKFLTWFNARPNEDPVFRAGIAHLWFVTIHPFEDGNGRIARAIADMSLARADGTQDRFYSMSSQIEAERKEYYYELEAAQRGDVNITRWLLWFLECLDRSIDAAEKGLAGVLHKAKMWERINRRPVNERQRIVLNRMLGGFEGFLTTLKYSRLAKCSNDTALRDIKQLVERGILLKNAGRGRGTSYRLAEPDAIAD